MHILFYNADSILSVLIVKGIIDTVIIHIYTPHVQVQHMWSTYTINIISCLLLNICTFFNFMIFCTPQSDEVIITKIILIYPVHLSYSKQVTSEIKRQYHYKHRRY